MTTITTITFIQRIHSNDVYTKIALIAIEYLDQLCLTIVEPHFPT